LAQSALAQAPNSNCKQAKGNWLDVGTAIETTGTITNAGFLNGTTHNVYNPTILPTPDPDVVSFASEVTITTGQGRLGLKNVYLYDFVNASTVMGRIDPSMGTGRFAGATGVLYFNLVKTIGEYPDLSFLSEISGQICFAQ
jgi:hypothetical protein